MESNEITGAGGGEAPEAPQQDSTPTPPAPEQAQAPQYVTAEDFGQVQQQIQQMNQFLQQAFAEPEPQPDYSQYNPAELAYLGAQQGLAPYQHVLQSAVEEAGKKQFNSIMDKLEADPSIGKVDRTLAEYAANGLLAEAGGDPRKAVELGARYAAEVRKQERQAAVDEYKASLKRQPVNDPGVGGAGVQTQEPAKTFDEVIARWEGFGESTDV